jgi:D-threo-aldose 1-dehydrogenase
VIDRNAIALGAGALGRADNGEPSTASVDLAVAMLTSGFPVVDTSNVYTNGRSERALGAAIRSLGGLPPGVEVVSKSDPDPATGRYDGERVRRSLDESLTRLGVERLPLYHLHDPHGMDARTALAPGGAVDALVALRAEGVVGSIGVATGPLSELGAFYDLGVFDAILTHNRYTLADRAADALIRQADADGARVFNAAPFGGGLLADSDRIRRTYAYRPAEPALLHWVGRVLALCRRAGVPIAALALNFAAGHPGVDHVVVGIASRARLDELGQLVDLDIPPSLLDEVAALGDPPSRETD